jgi:hypothetical protein
LVPVTIAQILSAEQSTPDDPFYINGRDVVNVRHLFCFCVDTAHTNMHVYL